ncbi:glucosamine-6-phosphate deaminase [Roseomonas marmotae]|uniref:Glucosamine-6-phosphate deaminase n=1 Tax=Roseomonas marmotae TaxID=2768161 RepID=A0ABS3KHT9_9PROT|nr:glucosamine-6-phosphate deaminase [Roseomonas marmotae]QTI80954.1 glucosamine-6-phosphate deaminase [Roseomonas marmotae]
MPRLVVRPDAAAVARLAAGRIAARLREAPDMVLGLATGGTMLPVYDALVALHRAGQAPLQQASSFNLDEYVGLPPDHPSSYAWFMREALFRHVGMDTARAHLPDGMAPDPQAEADRYEAGIAAAGGIALQLLGLGRNGHIGFNEPGSSFASRSRVVRLAAHTRADNQRFFPAGEAVPERAITMGIATILEAREILLVVTGAAKAPTLGRALLQPPAEDCPASALQTHGAVTVLCDEAAAVALPAEMRERGMREDA